ncbi:ankyrin, partial [Terfezia boudieri ATCC MYA-4762]
ILELLIRKTSGVDQRDINGNTPLHLAASRNNPNFKAVLKKLSLEEDLEMRKKSMVDFNATNELRQTPLHLAAWKGHLDMVDELIKEGAIIDADDNSNRSPLHWAAQGGNLDVV